MARGKAELAEQVWRRLWELTHSRRGTAMTVAAELGVTPGHVMALLSLDPHEPRPMGSLANQWQCDASNVTFLIDRLEERGFVERRMSPEDRRVRTIVLTPEGIAAKKRIEALMFEPPAPLLDLSADELATLDAMLERLAPLR